MTMVAQSNNKSAFDLLACATGGEAVTPSDSAELTKFARALYVGGTGNISVITTDGSTLTFSNYPDQTWLPVQCKQVKSTGTTATSIVAVW
jgi:hypothetical protein